MKTSFISNLLLLVLTFACTNDIKSNDVPANIILKFESLYPDVQEVKWDKEVKSYEASFMEKGKHLSISFDKDANVTETETEINKEEVPEPVLNNLNKKYPNGNLKSFTRINQKDVISYEIEMVFKNQDYEMFYTPEGGLIKQVLKRDE